MRRNKMLADKRGLELTLNSLIIAILVIIVLLVLVLIFTGVIGKNIVPSLPAFMSCDGRGGYCSASECPEGETQFKRFGGCGGEGYEGQDYCCIPPD